MSMVLVFVGALIFLAAGASALSRLATSAHQEKKSPRIPLIIAAIGLVLGAVGVFQSLSS